MDTGVEHETTPARTTHSLRFVAGTQYTENPLLLLFGACTVGSVTPRTA